MISEAFAVVGGSVCAAGQHRGGGRLAAPPSGSKEQPR